MTAIQDSTCLIAPFQRDKKSDFASAKGESLVRAGVEQTLGTAGASDFIQGEIAWRTEYGSLLHLLRHQKNDVALQELAKVYAQDALRKWNPWVVITNMTAQRLEDGEGNKLVLRIRYNVVERNVSGNQVVLEAVDQIVTL